LTAGLPRRRIFAAASRLMAAPNGSDPSLSGGDAGEQTHEVPRRRRVLIVDDEAAIRSLITTFLTRAGYQVDFGVDGQEAIEKLQAEHYDAVVTDLMMPRVDGIGVVRYLQEAQPDLLRRTIVLTAYPRLAESESIEGICSLVAKPFELANLRGMLQAMFETK
jgi:CheY-like chemotaxis protein